MTVVEMCQVGVVSGGGRVRYCLDDLGCVDSLLGCPDMAGSVLLWGKVL